MQLTIHRRIFLLGAAGLCALGPASRRARAAQRAASYDVTEKSIVELQAAMSAGEVTSAGLVERYLDRIAAYDQNGPRLNAVLFLNPNAIAEARALDDERARGRTRGALHGIPILLKDNLDTRDMPTTGGSIALSHLVPRDDAFQVRRLREAGAVLLGKVNLHELALGLTTVSSLGGQTLNPYDVRRTPGGSSGGSAVATAASFAACAIGTDTSGSIRIPSAHTAIVGLRPSAGLSSRAGIIPFGHTQDTGGPMARTVTDIALVLDATVGFDPADPPTAASSGRIPASYTAFLRPDALERARIGVLRDLFGEAPEDQDVAAIARRAVQAMTDQGAVAVETAIPDLGPRLAASNLLSQELKFYLGDYLRNAPGAAVSSVEGLLASGLHTAQFQAFLENANALPDDYLEGEDYSSRLAARAALAQIVTRVMDEQRLDALVYPTTRRIAPEPGGNQLGSNAALSAQTGCPAITVPAGFTDGGFPVGIEMLGRPFSEPTLLGLAYAYEQATRHRRPPPVTPPLVDRPAVDAPAVASSDTGPDSVRVRVRATGAQSNPPSDVPFSADARVTFNPGTRTLGYDIEVHDAHEVAGVYLHRRASRPNGGVAHILARSPGARVVGTVRLSPGEADDLQSGRLYLSAISRQNPRSSARADLVLP